MKIEHRTYNIGEISEKTGLQKTANGWVKPKKGTATKKEENTFSNVVKEIGEKQFRKNLQEYEDGVDWTHMSLNEIEQELKNYNIDPLTFYYKTREGSNQSKIKSSSAEQEKRNKENGAEQAAQTIKGQNLKKQERWAKEDAKALNENMFILQHSDGRATSVPQSYDDEMKRIESKGFKIKSLVHPDGSVERREEKLYIEKNKKWRDKTDYLGRKKITMKTKQGGTVDVYETDNPNQKNNRFRVDTGTHINTFNTLEEAKAFAEKHYGDTKEDKDTKDSACRITADTKIRLKK